MSWGMVAMGVGSLAGGLLSGKGKGGQTGYDVVQQPQYSFTEPRMRLASDYVSQNLARMQRGEYPAWYDKAQNTMRQGMQRNNYQATYGRPGQRTGTMQASMQAGAMGGLGPKSMMAQVGRAGQDYQNREKAINEYLAQQGVGVMQAGEQTYLDQSNRMPMGPAAQAIPYNNPGAQQANPWATLASGMGEYLGGEPWKTGGGGVPGISPTNWSGTSLSGSNPWGSSQYPSNWSNNLSFPSGFGGYATNP